MIDKENFILLGTINKPHGISGETAVRLISGMASREITPSFIFIDIETQLVPFRVNSTRYKSENVILLKLPMLCTEEKIKSMTGYEVFVSPDEISNAEPDINDISAFTNYMIKNVNGDYVGKISDMIDSPNNPLFVVEGSSHNEILIPAAEDLIVEIDDQKKEIVMVIPDGLLDVN
jgi:16S rRNA processing protein RimM